MPHSIIEHSASISGSILIEAVYQASLASDLFEPTGRDIKVRATAYSDFNVGNTKLDFIHVSLKILSGRSEEQKSSLSQQVLNQLSDLAFTNCAISVEVIDIDAANYAKTIS